MSESEPRFLVAAYLGRHPELQERYHCLAEPVPHEYHGPDALHFYDVLAMAEKEKGLVWHQEWADCGMRDKCYLPPCEEYDNGRGCPMRQFKWWYTHESTP